MFVEPVEEEINGVLTKVASMKKNLRQKHRDLDLVIRSFDREYLQLRARIERLEEHLKLPRLFDY